MDLRTIVRDSFFFGIGAISMTREKVEELVSELVKRGEMTRGEGKRLAEELTGAIDRARKEIDRQISKGTKSAAEALNLVTREEMKELERKVARLNEDLKMFRSKPSGKKGGKKTG